MKILVTGCAGFIGYHLSLYLAKTKNNKIYGLDNINSYYDRKLKKDRIKNLIKNKNFIFYKLEISNKKKINSLIKRTKITHVIHLAAQAGVRHSITHPEKYVKNNINGFFSILDCCRLNDIKHLIFASTSSVYGNKKTFPVNEKFNTDKPLSFYAASKKSNEVMAYAYSNIYNLPCTALRFFTVYGSYGRPDMSLFKFTEAIVKSKKINLYNKGDHVRDFTYIDDVVKYTSKLVNKPSRKKIPYNCFNVGSDKPQRLKYFLKLIEQNLNKKTNFNLLPLQQGDVQKTHADMTSIKNYLKIKYITDIKIGIKKFIKWYKAYY